MKFQAKLPHLITFGIILKIVISGLLLATLWELKHNPRSLSPAQQQAFNALQKSIDTLETKVLAYKANDLPQQRDLAREEHLIKNLSAIKSVHHILTSISNGVIFDSTSLQEFLSHDEWAKFLATQEKITGSDESLIQELKLCLRYIAIGDDGQIQSDKSLLGKMVQVEEVKVHDQDTKIKTNIEGAGKALKYAHYDMALSYLHEVPKDSPITGCMQGVRDAIQARIEVKKMLASLQERIINDK